MEWLESERDGARDFRLQTHDRLITGALWLPDNHSVGTPLILCGHGASGDRYQARDSLFCLRTDGGDGQRCTPQGRDVVRCQ